MWWQWYDRNTLNVFLMLLVLICFINVSGESQNAVEQSSMLNWLWSWVYFTFIKAAITITLYVMFFVILACLSTKKDVNDYERKSN